MFMAMKPALRVVADIPAAIGQQLNIPNGTNKRVGGNVLATVQLRGGGGGRGGNVHSTYSGSTAYGERGRHGSLVSYAVSLRDSDCTIGVRGENASNMSTPLAHVTIADDGTSGGSSRYMGYFGSGGDGGRGGVMGDFGRPTSDWGYTITAITNPDGTSAGRGGGLYSSTMTADVAIAGKVWVTVRGF